LRCRCNKAAGESCGKKGERQNLATYSSFPRGIEAPHSQRQGAIDNLGMYPHQVPPQLPRNFTAYMSSGPGAGFVFAGTVS
jgi:hypothetical protein